MSGTVTLRAKLRIPAMPNFLHIDDLRLDAAVARSDSLMIDVGSLDDQAITEFCAAWSSAFTKHAKARRAGFEDVKKT